MKRLLLSGAALAMLVLAPGPLLAQQEEGQDPLLAEMEALAAAIGNTSLTVSSHSIPANGQINFAEGASCPTPTRMLSGACHPGFSDQVRLVNQFPNVFGNTWRCGFRNNSASARTAWVYTLCAEEGAPPPVVQSLTVARFTTTTLTNADADRILADATRVAQTADFAGDVACNVQLARSGNVSSFSTGDGSIDSSSEFSAVIGVPGWVKAVNQINWCGSIGAGIIGCAPVPGSSFAIVRFSESLEGILWLHEYLHNKGRPHRDGTSNVMHPSIGSSRLGLNQDECNAALATPLLAAEGSPMAAMPGAEPREPGAPAPAGALPERMQVAAAGEEAPPEDIRDFILVYYIEGFPVAQALAAYSEEDVPAILEILNDDSRVEFHPNALAALAVLGGEESLGELIAYLEEDGGVLSAAEYRAKATVPIAIGFLANQTGSEEAVNYLIQGARGELWEGQDQIGRAEFQPSIEVRNEDMMQKFILGLAVTGDDRAIEALEALAREQPAVGREAAGTMIQDALEEARRVQDLGLEGYTEQGPE